MTASSSPSAAAARFCPACCPRPPHRSAAPPPNLPSPPPVVVRRSSSRSRPVRPRALCFVVAALIVFLGAGLSDAAEAPGRYEGVLGDAAYLIDVPPDWN